MPRPKWLQGLLLTGFSATAIDIAGNTAQASSVTFKLVVTYADLCTPTERFVTNLGAVQSIAGCAQLAEGIGNTTAKITSILGYAKIYDSVSRDEVAAVNSRSVFI